jgi:hypothetical protein
MSSRWKDPIVWATVTIAIATVVNISISKGMWEVTKENTEISRKVFEASFRPYVGAPKALALRTKNEKGEYLRALTVEMEIKNFGQVPAYNFEVITWRGLLDGIETHETSGLGGLGVKPTLLLPASSRFVHVFVRGDPYSKVVSGQARLEIELELQYTDPAGKNYRYRTKRVYDYTRRRFVTIEEEEYQPSS